MKIWRVFLLLLFIVFPFGQLARIDLLGSQLVIHANDFLVGGFVLAWSISHRRILLGILKDDPLTKPLVILIGAMFISLLINLPQYSFQQIAISALYPVRFMAYAGLYFVIKNLPETEKRIGMVGFIIAVLGSAVIGLIQYVVMPDTTFLAQAAWDDHYYRLVFPFLDPGFTGAILTLGLFAIYNFQGKIKGYLKYFALAVTFVAMMLTYSRASYLMYLIGFAVIGWYKKSIKIIIAAVVVFLIALPLLPKSPGEGTKLERETSTWARVENWKESVSIWQTRPIFGVGFNAYRYSRKDNNPQSHAGAGADSSVLLILATTGIIGLAAYLYLLKVIVEVHESEVLVVATLVGLFIHSWFNNTLLYPWVMETLWIFLALV